MEVEAFSEGLQQAFLFPGDEKMIPYAMPGSHLATVLCFVIVGEVFVPGPIGKGMGECFDLPLPGCEVHDR